MENTDQANAKTAEQEQADQQARAGKTGAAADAGKSDQGQR